MTAPSGWQPIETAPKDGTPILVFDEGAICIATFADDYWWDNGAMTIPPTHWMPLPDPPVAARGDAEGREPT